MKVIASFDDGTKEDLILGDMMRSYGIKTIFYFPVVPSAVNEPHGRVSLTPEERQLIAADHEIGSHTISHPLLTRVALGVAREEIFQSKLSLENEFNQEINAFCYPRGYANPVIQKLVQDAGYTHARGVNVGFLHESENPFYEQTTVHVGCDRKEYAGLNWHQYAQQMINQSTPDSVFHLWGHGWEIGKDVHNFDLLDKLCYQLTKGKSS